ncbi:MAG: serine/threonine protein kinase, partial [Cyanobacteria bacterium]|nr:serine/threonine protein kinase [Cyanobacteriota bacterium]
MKLCLVCNFQTAEDQDICPRDGSSMVTVGDDPLLGTVVEGRYKIQSVIGQGSAGTVYRAVQELIGREVAIKVLHEYLVSDDEFIKRFHQEAKASSRLTHPNIITIYDFGVIPMGQRPYIAMDLLVGTPLSDLLAQVEYIPMMEAIPIFTQVCSALGEAHRQGVVHRDVKPENIVLVERSGQKLFPMVVDFGIARIVEESEAVKITRTGTVCGSPTYMSPEQCTSSKVDHRSDVYSLGVVIFETLTGDVPFHSDELVRVMAMHLSDPPTPLNQVREGLVFPDKLEEVVYRALAKSPDQRYQSMEELAEALEDAVKKPAKPAVVAVPKKQAVEPGPLAQDEHLQPNRASTTELSGARNPQRPGGMGFEYSSMAMEEMNRRPSQEDNGAQDIQSMQNQINAMRVQMRKEQSESMKMHAPVSEKFSRNRDVEKPFYAQPFTLVLAGVILVVGYLVVASFTGLPGAIDFSGSSSASKGQTADEAQQLASDGKLEQAMQILVALNAAGKLSAG